MDGIQTTLQAGGMPGLEELARSRLLPLKYMLEKYREWKALKEKEAVGNAVTVQKPGTF